MKIYISFHRTLESERKLKMFSFNPGLEEPFCRGCVNWLQGTDTSVTALETLTSASWNSFLGVICGRPKHCVAVELMPSNEKGSLLKNTSRAWLSFDIAEMDLKIICLNFSNEKCKHHHFYGKVHLWHLAFRAALIKWVNRHASYSHHD